MQIEIKDELEDRVEKVREKGVREGIYPVGTTPEEVAEKIIRLGIGGEEQRQEVELYWRKKEEHNCAENIKYNGKYEFVGDAVLFYGKCSVCGKELVHTFYGEKNARETDEGFIHADQWRELTANDIISSIDVGLSVLKEKEGFGKEYHGQLLVLIEEIAKMLAREV